MSKESTNVELEPIDVVGGEIITDGKEKTVIPPEGMLKIDSDPKTSEVIIINLEGEWPKEKAKQNKQKDDEGRG